MWILSSLVIQTLVAASIAVVFPTFEVGIPGKEGYRVDGIEKNQKSTARNGKAKPIMEPHDVPYSSDGILGSLHGPQTILSAIPVTYGLTAKDNVGKLPALGWNSWNAYGCNITEDHFLSAAQKMIDLGLKDAGYQYVNVDDCYSQKERDYTTHKIVADFSKFPDGLNGTAKKVHDMGLKIGIYSSAGNYTCAGYPASLGYEDLDAQTFAEWGMDYLKYDNCNVPDNWKDECESCIPDSDNHQPPEPHPNGTCNLYPPPGSTCPDDYDWSKSKTAIRYQRMRDALQKQDRVMQYSLCAWGEAKVERWGNDTGMSWRSTGDIQANWKRVMEILNENSLKLSTTDFWGHSDPDMLEVGNGDLTFQQGRSHFALWAAMKSPLLIGTDLAKLSQDNVNVLKNKYLLAFNQDEIFGAPALPYKNQGWNETNPADFWSGKFKQGTLVLALNNQGSDGTKIIDYSEIPGLSVDKAYQITEAWSDTKWGCVKGGFNVKLSAYDTAVIVVGDECSTPSNKDGFISKGFTS